MYAAGSEKERRAGGRLHGGTIAHPFVFCKGGWRGPRTPASARRWGRMVLSWPVPSISGGAGLACAFHQRRVWLGVRPPSAKGLAWRAPSISEGSGLACALHQRRVWLGVRPPSAKGLAWRAPSISEGSGLACAVVPPAHPPTFGVQGDSPLYPRRGLRPPAPCLRGRRGRRLLTWRVGKLLAR